VVVVVVVVVVVGTGVGEVVDGGVVVEDDGGGSVVVGAMLDEELVVVAAVVDVVDAGAAVSPPPPNARNARIAASRTATTASNPTMIRNRRSSTMRRAYSTTLLPPRRLAAANRLPCPVMSSSARPVLAVLAGGAARRMGRDKATTLVGGTTMQEAVLDALASVPGDLVVVGHGVSSPSTATTADLRPGRQGPLAGLEAALRFAAGRTVFLVAVDQPYLRPETVRHLLDLDGDIVVPVASGHPQVTCAVYRPACLTHVEAIFAEGGRRSIRELFGRVTVTDVTEETWRAWGEDGRSWFSIDTPEDIAEALERFGPPPLRSGP